MRKESSHRRATERRIAAVCGAVGATVLVASLSRAAEPEFRVDDSRPVVEKRAAPPSEDEAAAPEDEPAIAPDEKPDAKDSSTPEAELPPVPDVPEPEVGAFKLLGESIAPGHQLRLTLRMGESFAGAPMMIPVTITHGTLPGPTICLVAGIHGDELNGVEIVRRTVAATPIQGLRGTLVGLPIANLHGLQRGSRYLPDRRDLNRYFPGSRKGSAASRIADVIFRRIVRNCDLLVDFHTGSLRRKNLPQLRADLANPAVVDLAVRFGDMPVVHTAGGPGTLRRAATDIGIPTVTYEAGEPLRFNEADIIQGLKKTSRLLSRIDRPTAADPRTGLFWQSRWVRVDEGGIFMSRVALGDEVNKGDVLGIVTNPLTGDEAEVSSPNDGLVIGIALNQVVIPGFAAYHLGIASDVGETGSQEDAEPEEEKRMPPEDDDAS